MLPLRLSLRLPLRTTTTTLLSSTRTLSTTRSLLASGEERTTGPGSSPKDSGSGSQASSPGWSGRPGSDHVLHRDGRDAQSAPSKQARDDKAAGKEGSGAISQKDERNAGDRAKEEFPEAKDAIGMNSGEFYGSTVGGWVDDVFGEECANVCFYRTRRKDVSWV